MNSNTNWLSLIDRKVHGAFSAYRQVYGGKTKQTKQTTKDVFLKRVKPALEEPWAGPPEPGIVTTGQDSSLCFIGPEHPQGDKSWRWEPVILVIPTLHRPTLMCVFVS